MDDKIDKTLEYYSIKKREILDFVNSQNNLTTEQIIESGEGLEALEYKITALEIAKEN
ncbi:hypothetical protein Q4512_03530 [Oceanihabitans sp. 2_MG-2023]|uniref:hypothetical protein n=1 Tax=Oceanihabitans sp. 2_MG-2023 TaxID=3062661 RepID=UPI0026E122FE|nr:hypothetical protein [Oceanihabitans sp. 2_MG-2023]MDO6595971.1 hypothetical protein [Oceanihabitans sp. 2_MG-2023]